MKLVVRSLLVLATLSAVTLLTFGFMTWMPGDGSGVIERSLTPDEQVVRDNLRRHVEFIAAGPRHPAAPEHQAVVVEYLRAQLAQAGWTPQLVEVETADGPFHNIIARRDGTERPDEIVVIGAHWDTRGLTPGADDNASGCAAVLEVARWLRDHPSERTVELALWATEEPPFFQSPQMGSYQHASALRETGATVVVALSLEMLGYFDPAEGAQKYPGFLSMFYPTHGAFIAFVGSMWHRNAVTTSAEVFRAETDFPAEGFAGPETMPGIGWSDHWSFWQHDVPALMVSDTSFFRTPHYHKLSDLPETLDYERFARVVVGLRPVIAHWAVVSDGIK